MDCIYTTKDGRSKTRTVKHGHTPPKFILIDGKRGYRDHGAEKGGRTGNADPWPLHSNSLRFSPSRKEEFEQFMGSNGIQATLDKKGRVIMRDNQHRNAILEATNQADLDAGYGQRAPTAY